MNWKIVLLALFPFFSLSNAGGLNFYISQQESYRVLGNCYFYTPSYFLYVLIFKIAFRFLGLTAELAYVRDGSINDVAQHFVIPVPQHIQELCFVWENADLKVVKDFKQLILLNTFM